MTFDNDQLRVIRQIVRHEMREQLKDIPTKAQFKHFATQVMRSNTTLNNAVQQSIGKQDGFTAMVNAKDEVVTDIKKTVSHYVSITEDTQDRMALLIGAIYGSDMSTGDSLIEIVKRNSKSIEVISKWVENETERQTSQAKWRAKMFNVAFVLLQNSAIRWIIVLGGGLILGLEGHEVLESLMQ